MKCSICGGLVTWRGPLTDLTHTECERCGARNSQEPDWPEPDGSDEIGSVTAVPIGARDPVGFAQHLLRTAGAQEDAHPRTGALPTHGGQHG